MNQNNGKKREKHLDKIITSCIVEQLGLAIILSFLDRI